MIHPDKPQIAGNDNHIPPHQLDAPLSETKQGKTSAGAGQLPTPELTPASPSVRRRVNKGEGDIIDWHSVLDQNGDGIVDASDLNIALFKAGSVLPFDAFIEVVADTPKIAKFVDGASLVEAINTYDEKLRTCKLPGTTEYILKRWASLTFCLGWAFLEHLFPKEYYGRIWSVW